MIHMVRFSSPDELAPTILTYYHGSSGDDSQQRCIY